MNSAEQSAARSEAPLLYRLRGVSKTVERRRKGQTARRVAILHEINLDIRASETTVLMGPSGAGKSTLLHILAGLDVPTSGTVELWVEGTDGAAGEVLELHSLDESERARLRRRNIGVVFQAFHLVRSLRAWENVALPLLFQGIKRDRRRGLAMRALSDLGLAGRSDHYPDELSGGEQQRVALARAVVTEPTVLLADEPTGNLDTKTARDLIPQILERVGRGQALILVTHDTELASTVAGRIIHLVDGRVVDGSGKQGGG